MLNNVSVVKKLMLNLHKDVFDEDKFNVIVDMVDEKQKTGIIIEDGVDVFIVGSLYFRTVMGFGNDPAQELEYILGTKALSPYNNHVDSTMLCIQMYSMLYPYYSVEQAYILKEALKYCIPF